MQWSKNIKLVYIYAFLLIICKKIFLNIKNNIYIYHSIENLHNIHIKNIYFLIIFTFWKKNLMELKKYRLMKKSRIKFNKSATLSVILMLLARLWVLNLMLNHARNVAQMRAAKSSLDKLHHRAWNHKSEKAALKRERERAFLPLAYTKIAILKSVSDDAEIPRVFCSYHQFLFFTLLSFIVSSVKISIGKILDVIYNNSYNNYFLRQIYLEFSVALSIEVVKINFGVNLIHKTLLCSKYA